MYQLNSVLKIKFRILAFVLAGVFIFCATFAAHAENLPFVPFSEQKTIRVGFSAFPPWRIETEDGKEKGIEVEYLKELLRRMNLTPEFVHAPFVRNIKSMESGNIDLMIGVLRRPDREKHMLFLEPPYARDAKYAFFVLRQRCCEVSKYEDLKGLIVGVSNGVAYFQEFDDDLSLKKDHVRTVYQNIDKLIKGRIDVFVSEESTAKYILANKKLADVICETDFIFNKKQPVYIVLSRSSQFYHMANDFSKVINDLNTERYLERQKIILLEEINRCEGSF